MQQADTYMITKKKGDGDEDYDTISCVCVRYGMTPLIGDFVLHTDRKKPYRLEQPEAQTNKPFSFQEGAGERPKLEHDATRGTGKYTLYY